MAVIVNGDGILTGISSLATALTDITSGRGTVTGVATVGTLQLGAGVSISSPRTQQAAIFTNNTEFLTIDDAGRVGVGTITPNSDAHPENEKKINVGFITARSIAGDIDANTMVVAGVSTFVGALNASSVVSSGAVSGTTATFTGGILLDDSISHIGDTDTKIRFSAANTVSMEVNGSEGFKVDTTGTTLTSTTDASLFINTTNSNGSHIRFQTSGTNKTFLGQASGIAGSLGGANDFAIRSAEDIVLSTNNNNTPNLTLNTSGQLVMSNTVTTEFIQLTSTNNSTRAVIAASGKDSGGNAVTIKLGGFGDTSRGEIFTQTNHDLGFATNNAATQMVLSTGGKLGINQTSPDTMLHLKGDPASNGAIIRLENHTAMGQDELVGAVEFEKQDASGAGAGLCGGMRCRSDDSYGARTYIAFSTRGNSTGEAATDTERLRIMAQGGVTFNGDTSYDNSLDDYEEGTFTPNNTIGMPLTSNFPAQYVKVGDLCWIMMDITFNSSPADTSQCGLIQSLPFTAKNLTNGEQYVNFPFISESGSNNLDHDLANTVTFIEKQGTSIKIYNFGLNAIQQRAFLAGRRMRFNFCYRTE